MTRTTEYKSPLGRMLLAVDEEGLTGAWFEGRNTFRKALPRKRGNRSAAGIESACRWLDLYFSGQEPDFMPRLHLEGQHSAGRSGNCCGRSLRQNDHLRCAGKAAGSGDRQAGVGAGSGRRSGA